MNDLVPLQPSRPDIDEPDAQSGERHTAERVPADSGARSSSRAFLILLIVVVLPVSALTPPFQSPDEFNHIKRAYLLSKGQVFLSPTGSDTGGNINSGLLNYMSIFERMPFSYPEKVTQKMLRDARRISWSHNARFSSLPNTAVYFPLSYLPQAAALLIGERSGLSVNHTYFLARAFSLVGTIALLWVATRLYTVPLPVYALFAMPMVIFQMGSASLDAISFAMCVLAAALFMRAADHRLRFGGVMHIAFICCLLLLVTARTNLIGIVWLPLVLYACRRERPYLISSCILIVLCLGWIVFAAVTVKGAGTGLQIQHISAAGILSYYLIHIDELVTVMYSTLTSGALLLSYWRMFVGVLGWIDTPLDWAVYWMFAIALAALAITSAPTNARALLSAPRVSLVLGAGLSTLLLFLIFLATFTLHPANFIGAIQGRYFYPMAIFLAFALCDWPLSRTRINIGRAIVVSMMVLSSASMVPKLIGRYWAA